MTDTTATLETSTAPANVLRTARAYIFDMDGVLYRGSQALPGVADLFNILTLRGVHFLLATNNSMATQEAYVTRMAGMGVEVTIDQIQTSSTVTRDVLKEQLPSGARVLPVGMPALEATLLSGTGFTIATGEAGETVDAVVVGLDLDFTYEKLRRASDAVLAGAKFVATNADATLPHESGFQPGAGSIVAAIATATGVTPLVVGKPQTLMMTKGVEGLGVLPGEAIMVGDRLDTDILAGHRAGLHTAMVLTGVSQREHLATAEVLPDFVFADLPALTRELTADDSQCLSRPRHPELNSAQAEMFTMQSATTTSGTQLRFGTAPVNWNNFDLENWNPVVPFPQILDEMVAAGFSLTEWDASFGSDPEMLNRERDDRGISYVGAYRWIDFLDESGFTQSLAGIEEILPTLVSIGVDNLIVADSLRPERVAIAGAVPVDGSKSLSEGELQTLARNLHRLASRVQESGIAVRYHNHVGSYIESPAEVAALLPHLDLTLVDLCFDTGHYAFGGGDALEFLRSHIDSIGLLHLKDVDDQVLDRARQHQWSFQESLRNYIFCPLGHGAAQVEAIIGELIQSQFGGYVIIEQDTCVGDQTANARNNLATALAFEARVQSAGDTHD